MSLSMSAIRCALALLLLTGTVSGSPSKTFGTTFDTLPAVALGAPATIPTPIDDIAFNGFHYRTDFLVTTSHSPKNAIASPQLNQTLNGAPPSNFSTIYKGSKVKYFKLSSVYLGCIVSSAGNLNGPIVPAGQPCNVLFSGYNSKNQHINQSCSFSDLPVSATAIPLQQCVFGPEFGDAVALNQTVENALTLPETTTIYIDDVVHTNYYN